MSAGEERRRILDLLDNGIITAEQAIQLLATIETEDEGVEDDTVVGNADLDTEAVVLGNRSAPEAAASGAAPTFAHADADASDSAAGPGEREFSTPEDAPEPEPVSPVPPFDPGQAGWRGWWQWPMWIGVGVTVVAAILMYLAYQGSGFGFWFACMWFPFLFGVMLMALAWASRTARWIHIRIQQKPGERPERIAISLPIPLRFTAWFLRTFRPHLGEMNKVNPADMIMALKNVTPETPFYVKVDEGDDGEKVEVYIG
jgi:hypothetical protein